MNVKSEVSSTQRKKMIAAFIKNGGVVSQSHLVALLSKQGIKVTQATASRDLEDLGAVRVRGIDGLMEYALPDSPTTNSGNIENLILEVSGSANLVVIKTPPGGAQLLASAIDRNSLNGFAAGAIGTIAGDDTVIVVSQSATGGARLAKSILSFRSDSTALHAKSKTSNNKLKSTRKSKRRGN
jgi:transcriptional regulator of arginine metabolism